MGALIACPGCALLDRLRIDDPVGCVPIHLFASVWGLLAVALFAEKDTFENSVSEDLESLRVVLGDFWEYRHLRL